MRNIGPDRNGVFLTKGRFRDRPNDDLPNAIDSPAISKSKSPIGALLFYVAGLG